MAVAVISDDLQTSEWFLLFSGCKTKELSRKPSRTAAIINNNNHPTTWILNDRGQKHNMVRGLSSLFYDPLLIDWLAHLRRQILSYSGPFCLTGHQLCEEAGGEGGIFIADGDDRLH